MKLNYVKKIKGAADKNCSKNATCKHTLTQTQSVNAAQHILSISIFSYNTRKSDNLPMILM